MSLIIPPGFALLVHEFKFDTDPELMVFTMGVELGSVTDPDDVAGQGYQAFVDAFGAGYWWDSSRFVGVTAYLGNDGPTIVGEHVGDLQGTDNRTVLPSNCAFLVRKRTGTAGRRGRGRCYLPSCFLPETLVDPHGNISTARHDADVLAVDEWLTQLTGGPPARFANAVVFHDSAGSGTEPPPTVITALEAEIKIATRRTRMRP